MLLVIEETLQSNMEVTQEKKHQISMIQLKYILRKFHGSQ